MRKFSQVDFGFNGNAEDALMLTGIHGCNMVDRLDSFANLIDTISDNQTREAFCTFFIDYKTASTLLALRAAMDSGMVEFENQPMQAAN